MSEQLFRLDGAVAVVTGASGWLGPSMVAALHDAGAHVYAVGRDRARLVAAVGEDSERLTLRPCDVTTSQWDKLLGALPRLDVLVQNAHVGRGGSLKTATTEQFDEAYELAVKASWRGMLAARPALLGAAAAGGAPSVINVASMYGLVAPDFSMYATEEGRNPPFYGAAKAALLQLTRYAAAELGPDGIRVNALTPGPFPGPAAQANETFVAQLRRRTMTDTVGAPEDLATALLFLASPHSRFVTASNVVVDGGWTSR